MTTKIVLRKGNSAINSAYTGEVAELTYDSDNRTIRIHNGNVAGGTRAVSTNANGLVVSTNTLSVATFNSTVVNANTLNVNTLSASSVAEPVSNTQPANKLYVDRKVRLAIALSGA